MSTILRKNWVKPRDKIFPEPLGGEFGGFVTVIDIYFHHQAEMALGLALCDDQAKKSPKSYLIWERQKVANDKDGIPAKIKQFYLQASVEEHIPEVTNRKEVASIDVDLNSDQNEIFSKLFKERWLIRSVDFTLR